mmetsp:Transcript_20551/g.69686  ORF Transcript_20551/g.69686 Transcript_20551/m.69686 type:complete len:576 (-) Transcript_20551:51-1778(-)
MTTPSKARFAAAPAAFSVVFAARSTICCTASSWRPSEACHAACFAAAALEAKSSASKRFFAAVSTAADPSDAPFVRFSSWCCSARSAASASFCSKAASRSRRSASSAARRASLARSTLPVCAAARSETALSAVTLRSAAFSSLAESANAAAAFSAARRSAAAPTRCASKAEKRVASWSDAALRAAASTFFFSSCALSSADSAASASSRRCLADSTLSVSCCARPSFSSSCKALRADAVVIRSSRTCCFEGEEGACVFGDRGPALATLASRISCRRFSAPASFAARAAAPSGEEGFVTVLTAAFKTFADRISARRCSASPRRASSFSSEAGSGRLPFKIADCAALKRICSSSTSRRTSASCKRSSSCSFVTRGETGATALTKAFALMASKCSPRLSAAAASLRSMFACDEGDDGAETALTLALSRTPSRKRFRRSSAPLSLSSIFSMETVSSLGAFFCEKVCALKTRASSSTVRRSSASRSFISTSSMLWRGEAGATSRTAAFKTFAARASLRRASAPSSFAAESAGDAGVLPGVSLAATDAGTLKAMFAASLSTSAALVGVDGVAIARADGRGLC